MAPPLFRKVFHGTGAEIKGDKDFLKGRLDLSAIGSGAARSTGVGVLNGPGFYVSEVPQVAKKYAYPEGRIYSFNLPWDVPEKKLLNWREGQTSSMSERLKDLDDELKLGIVQDNSKQFPNTWEEMGLKRYQAPEGYKVLYQLKQKLKDMKDITNLLSEFGVLGSKYPQPEIPGVTGNNYAIWSQKLLDDMSHSIRMQRYRDPFL